MTTENTFKIGDVVQLKSGGPKMTYEGATGMDDDVLCTWFEGKKVESRAFKPGSLKLAPEDKPMTGAAFVVGGR